MKDPFRYQITSPNLTRIQDNFLTDTGHNFKTNYTITNKAIHPFKDSSSSRKLTSQSPIFVKKYNKTLNEFCLPQSPYNITVDLDQKLKLNYLQIQIADKKNNIKKSSREQLDEINLNYLVGSPNHSCRTKVTYDIKSPKSPKSQKRDIVQDSNDCSNLRNCVKTLTERKANPEFKSTDFFNRKGNESTKSNLIFGEFYNSMFNNDAKELSMFEKSFQLKDSDKLDKFKLKRDGNKNFINSKNYKIIKKILLHY